MEKEKPVYDQMLKQHIQPRLKPWADNDSLRVDGITGIAFCKFSIFINLYFPGYLPGQELAPSSKLKGCQRVIEPDLSPLLYKSNTPFAKFDRIGIATK